MKLYRFNSNQDSPANDTGLTMWAASLESVENCYGPIGWMIEADDSNSIEFWSIRESVINQLTADMDINYGGFDLYTDLDDYAAINGLTIEAAIEMMVDDMNPGNIVDTAGAWDSMNFVEWFADRVADLMENKVILTDNGGVTFYGDKLANRIAD